MYKIFSVEIRNAYNKMIYGFKIDKKKNKITYRYFNSKGILKNKKIKDETTINKIDELFITDEKISSMIYNAYSVNSVHEFLNFKRMSLDNLMWDSYLVDSNQKNKITNRIDRVPIFIDQIFEFLKNSSKNNE